MGQTLATDGREEARAMSPLRLIDAGMIDAPG